MGWSEIPRYAFDIPDGWQETPVSIADLGGTEVRLRPTLFNLHAVQWYIAASVDILVCTPVQAAFSPKALCIHESCHVSTCKACCMRNVGAVLQIDVRFASRDQGSLAVVVAPVLRFAGRPWGLPLSHACAGMSWTCAVGLSTSE